MYLKNQLAKKLSLDGAWQFALGESQPWSQIQVPGCWEAQGYSKYTDGPAFFRREVVIPAGWAGESILIEFGAVSYACTVRVNGTVVGEQRGLWTPFAFEITPAAWPGQANLIELDVYKPGLRYPMRSCLAGFLPDVATSFGGLWQPVCLRALTVGLEDVLVDPDPETGRVRVRGRAVGLKHEIGPGTWKMGLYSGDRQVASLEAPLAGGDRLDATLAVPGYVLWSPDRPALYELHLQLVQAGQAAAQVSQRFGFRRLEAQGGLVLFNGQPVLLRGVLSWGWQPDRIAPAYTPERARDEIRRVKALGFNLIKLCLFIPDQTYFEIADEEGIFLWEELPLWLPEVTADLRARAPGEYTAITRLTRHHPSVVLYSLGCELSQSVDAGLLDQLNAAVRGLLADVLVCDNSGSGESYGGLDFDFSDFTDYHPYYDLHFFEPLLDNWRRDWLPARPWIFGEFSDSDGYRDLTGLKAANGGQKPWWLTDDNPISTWRPEARALVEVEERLARLDLEFAPPVLVRIAAGQSMVARKYTLEVLRRRNGMGGYVVTGLRDTPIATSGVFDDFDRPKWPAETLRQFNADAILCLDTGRRRRWTHGGDRPDRLDIYNHWGGPQSGASWHIILSAFGASLEKSTRSAGDGRLTWRLSDLTGNILDGGQFSVDHPLRPGSPLELAALSCWLPVVTRACQLRLEASLSLPGLEVSNAWPIWVYPPVRWPAGLGIYDPSYALDGLDDLLRQARRLEPGDEWEVPLVLSTAWCEKLDGYLRAGGRVLLLQQGDGPLLAQRGPFWREGLKLFSPHPLWQVFPNQGFTDLQFFGLASDLMLDAGRLPEALPGLTEVRPILRRLDEREFSLREYLLEAKVGRGCLLACSLRVQGGVGAQPAGLLHNVAGAYLLWAMLDHLLTDPL